MHSTNSTPGRMGYPGKWPSKILDSRGTSARARIVPATGSPASTRSTIWKYSRRMTPANQVLGQLRGESLGPPSGRLCRPQFIDPGAEIAQDEVVVDRALALVDVLHPLLDGHLDGETLVDGEGDVQKIEAVDAEIVDGVGCRLDRRPVDIASLGNDVRDGVKGILHDLPVPYCGGRANRAEFRHIPRKSQSLL